MAVNHHQGPGGLSALQPNKETFGVSDAMLRLADYNHFKLILLEFK
jgi:hypothetical protein